MRYYVIILLRDVQDATQHAQLKIFNGLFSELHSTVFDKKVNKKEIE